MSLSLEEIERVFQRLAATYPQAWEQRLEISPLMEQKTVWGHELREFNGRPGAIDFALEHLPEYLPNIIEFKNLCRSAPKPRQVYVAEAYAPSKRVAKHMEKLRPILEQPSTLEVDGKGWAWRIIEEHRSGVVVNYSRMRDACMALRIPNPPPSTVEVPAAYRSKVGA